MLKFLIIFFSIIYLGGLLGKWLMRRWFVNLSKRQSQYQNPPQNKKEGEVTVNYSQKDGKRKNSGEGEYIDYEEVE